MERNLDSKVILGLERISEVFRTLLWEKAKVHGVSPIQIQILLFISDHEPQLCKVSHLAKEFDLTKPTISDAIKVLHHKQLVNKEFSTTDTRSYTINLSRQGQKLVKDLKVFDKPLREEIQKLDNHQLDSLFTALTRLVYRLNRRGIISVQRTCFACRFYSIQDGNHHCSLLQEILTEGAIRLDCPEFVAP